MVCKARPTRPRHNIPKVASRDLIDYFYGEINTYMHVQNIKVNIKHIFSITSAIRNIVI